ncbi:Smr/MutS family protein, partial [Balneolaceae bacterium ANBcel3]|nr:Smr/MutS family protein [Balneolaceae bacterium ANBcel3]
LKTVGLLTVLTQCGIPVPADEGAIIPLTKGIFVDMGDEQSIESDLSTFSSRLHWMKTTLERAQENSLVLVDEAGSGTDPDEGTALTTAFLEILSEKKTRCLITTHHGLLKLFAHEAPGWQNASMEFDQTTLSPTYRFKKGIPGSSYAFEIAERLGLPEILTQKARKQVGTGKNKLDSLILSLEKESQQLRSQISDLRKKDQIREKIKQDLEQRLQQIREQKEDIHSKAMKEAESIISQANKKIEQAIRAAVEQDKEAVKAKRKEIADYESSLKKKQEKRRSRKQRKKQPASKQKPVPGDAVKLLDSHSTGELLDVKGSSATVLINGLRIKTKYQNLVLTSKVPQRPAPSISYKVTTSYGDHARPFSGRLDVRGKRGEEAMREVVPFVDEALTRGIQHISIVHGKGDGILKKLIHEHLASRKDIKHFEAAPVDEGGDGCTYIYL